MLFQIGQKDFSSFLFIFSFKHYFIKLTIVFVSKKEHYSDYLFLIGRGTDKIL